MIGKLMAFELKKRWRFAKYILFGYLGIQVLILFVTRLFLWNEEIAGMLINGDTVSNNISLPFALTMFLVIMLALALGAFPFIEGIYRFERDLSGKQAYLELMIPAPSWKKVLAKLAATLCSLIVFGTLSLLSIFLYFVVNLRLDASFFEFMAENLRALMNEGPDVVLVVLYLLFGFASAFMIIFFCISVAKSFTHRNMVAVPIGILVFLIITGLLSALGIQLEKVPLAEFQVFRMEVSLSMILADIVAFLAAFAGTSWLMEKKIEH